MSPRAIFAAGLLLLALPCSAEIYRCEIDGVVTFSDRPCGSDATRHEESKGVSFVTPDENLPALAEAAQAFIRQRRERLSKRRSGSDTTAESQTQPAEARVERVYVPWPAPGHLDGRPSRQKDRGRGDNMPPINPERERYSPLNGPILGTRPESAAFERRRQSQDRDRSGDRSQ